ncbi:unnamed protein product [Rotaria socialis]|nr:unnamed protein product [Rotaria socialis]
MIRNSLLPNGTFSSTDDIHIISNLCVAIEQWSPLLTDGILVDNCTFVINISKTAIAQYIRAPFIGRFVSIDVSIIIYFVGVDRGVFETQQFGKLKIEIV